MNLFAQNPLVGAFGCLSKSQGTNWDKKKSKMEHRKKKKKKWKEMLVEKQKRLKKQFSYKA